MRQGGVEGCFHPPGDVLSKAPTDGRQPPREGGGRRLAPFLGSGGLLDQAAAALQRRLAADPENSAALERLGDVHRGRGDFPAALAAYRRLQALRPGHAAAAWAIAVLAGGRLPDAAPPGRRPAPFVRMANFLAPAARDRLLARALSARGRFVPAQVQHPGRRRTLNHEDRNALSLTDARMLRSVRSWFVPKLRGVLPEVLARLRMKDLDASRIDLQVTAHLCGGFFTAHTDDANERRRKLSYVCYFHRHPRPFTGGDLLLYDAGGHGRDAGERPGAFSRIGPLLDSIVFFPSGCWHEVTPVTCGDDFGDGRFTVNGWVLASA